VHVIPVIAFATGHKAAVEKLAICVEENAMKQSKYIEKIKSLQFFIIILGLEV
jgi:hypothetical protein